MAAAVTSKYAAFLKDIKEKGHCGQPMEVCISAYSWKATATATDHILNDINAKFTPGTMTLVLGAPGCGKTSLLKAVAGIFPTNIVSGSITYNGVKTTAMQAQLRHLVTFAGQKDEHIPTLTVKETLEFAHACRNVHGSFNCEAGTAAIIDMLGLERCQNTLVGDDFVRGVSGGQRRRVSLGEMLTGQSPILLLDEYTTGLDATVATEITQKLRDMCNAVQYTVITALLQPPPEVFALFDNVLILADGHMAYFGPCGNAVAYFESIGFARPSITDTADFLQEVTTAFGRRYAVPSASVPSTGREFHDRFRNTDAFKALGLDAAGGGSKGQPTADLVMKETAAGSHPLRRHNVVGMVFQRQLKLVLRDKQFNKIRIGQSLLMGLAIGSLFGKLGFTSKNVPEKVGLIFLTILFTSVVTLANIAYTIQIRGVYQKQAIFRLYPAWAYAAAESFLEVICCAIQVFLFTVTTYWMCEFSAVDSGSHYGLYYLVVFLNSVSVTQCFKFIASSAATSVGGLILGAATIFILVIFSGFAIQGPALPTYLTWLFDLNPGSWAFWALVQNEYTSSIPEYDNPHPLVHKRMGDYYMLFFGVSTDSKYITWAIGYLTFCYVFMACATAFGYQYIRHAKKYAPKKEASSHAVVPLAREEKHVQHTIEFTPVTLSFHELFYTVTLPKTKHGPSQTVELLSDIHGHFVPGTMTALMGTSGAGKSTLMDVLAGRKNSGKIKGVIKVNGRALTKATQTQFGYVEQFDLHCVTATVEEALSFSAYLRLADTRHAHDLIQSTLHILELDGQRHRRISLLSNEQSKRVTIGVELVANPSVLFLDEPTSGLDVHAAKVVCDAMQRISKSGRTVICTIHQPSFVLFEMFDALVLLRSGGKMVYFGPLDHGLAVVDYFQSTAGVRDLHPQENPATYMLDVLAANPSIDFTSLYLNSTLCAHNLNKVNPTTGSAAATTVDGELPPRHASSYSMQLYQLGLRTLRKYWRTQEYSVGRVFISLFVALTFGILFKNDGAIAYTAQVQSQVSLIFIGPLFMGIIAVITGLPVVDAERMVFFRERASGMYATWPYTIVFAVVEIPYVVVNSLVFALVFYFMLHLAADAVAFGWFYLYFCLHTLFATYLGQLLVAVLPDLRTAIVATGGVNSLFSLFAGFFIHKNSIPDAWIWMYWISPLHYAVEGMLATQFLANHTPIFVGSQGAVLSPVNTTIAEFTLSQFGGGLSLDNKLTDVGVLIGIVVIVVTGCFFGQQFISFVTR
ncbi:Aste57867_235 [Aphanomyces stellatus]|uniref:Aste57867_235 protein n=1 Tax=Aphanomyces stellatus TaxID=120398 RepID=A0A485K359_9STRA|nr:hypothetical protein As57867_000235 [Aphanomyces stellatus]VFT77461.1 Aste57867_235 [Aphanomyces stellatus]